MTKIYFTPSVFKCYLCNVCRNKDFLGNTSLALERGEREVPADTA